MSDGRVLMQRDDESGIARVTLANPERRNAYDPEMRRQLGAYLDELAYDDVIKVVLFRGEGGVFSAGADMNNAYAWYGDRDRQRQRADGSDQRRPSQRRRLLVDRQTFDFYHFFMGYPKATVAEVSGLALGGGLELALMADIAVVASDTVIGMPATRLLGPALGSLHLFFHRLGPVLARRLLLTGDTAPAGEVSAPGVFTEVVDDVHVEARAAWWAEKVARMPADGIVMAKEAFRLVEQLQAYQGEEVASYLFHAYGTNLRSRRASSTSSRPGPSTGPSEAFELRDAHFDVPEPEAELPTGAPGPSAATVATDAPCGNFVAQR